jgi:pectinesterase
MKIVPLLLPLFLAMPLCAAVKWDDALKQPADFYATAEAAEIAENLLLYQRDTGGWPKNTDMAAALSDSKKTSLTKDKTKTDSTIDNNATNTQIAFLLKVHAKTSEPDKKYLDAANRGVDFLLASQYDNGGFPQYHPNPKGYYARITFNDNAMINVLMLLQKIAAGEDEFKSIDDTRKKKSAAAVEKGIACILKCQFKQDGNLTAWCAQHDEKTFEPAQARAYEHPSLSGHESAGITLFLMSLEKPSPEIIASVNAAVAWFEKSKLTGIRIEKKSDPKDVVVIEDEKAPPIWPRFADLKTNKPIFSGRDGVIKATLAEIENERRTGYSWYSNSPAKVLEAYPKWKAKFSP